MPTPRPDAATRLLCLPSAGSGAAVFFAWGAAADPALEVAALRLPGRESRIREPLLEDVGALAALVDAAIDDADPRPFALFGHSMGALLAWEVTRRRAAGGRRLPERLFVSGRHAPHLPEAKEPWHGLDDEILRARLGALGGMPPALLDDRDIRAMTFPIIRADLRACETFAPAPARPLPVAITAFGGEDDPLVPEAALREWGRHAGRGFTARRFPGGHFYLLERRDDLLAAVAAVLRPPEG